MKLQTLYNKVAKHLLTQNKRSVDKDGNCLLRGPNGLKCAIGCLIPYNKYVFDMDERKYEFWTLDLLVKRNVIPACRDERQYQLMFDLLSMHDEKKPSRWPSALRRIAREFGLKPYELDL